MLRDTEDVGELALGPPRARRVEAVGRAPRDDASKLDAGAGPDPVVPPRVLVVYAHGREARLLLAAFWAGATWSLT